MQLEHNMFVSMHQVCASIRWQLQHQLKGCLAKQEVLTTISKNFEDLVYCSDSIEDFHQK